MINSILFIKPYPGCAWIRREKRKTMEKLTKTEYAAKSACITFKANDGGEFRLIWTPSKQWGHTAKTEHRGQRTGFASGYGYDK